MPGEIALETEKLLDSAEWHWKPLAPVIAEMASVVAPGRALRVYQRGKARSDAERSGKGPTRPPLTETEQIISGARRIARDSLNSQRYTGRIEVQEVDGVEYFRFGERRRNVKPCSNCGHVESAMSDEQVASSETGAPNPPVPGSVMLHQIPATPQRSNVLPFRARSSAL